MLTATMSPASDLPAYGRPTVAVVVLVSGQRAPLAQLGQVLMPAAQQYGARVLLAPTGSLRPGSLEPLPPGVEVLEGALGLSQAEIRCLAIRQLPAHVVVFVDEAEAMEEPWPDLLALRAGVLRTQLSAPGAESWQAYLTSLAVERPNGHA